MARRVSDSFPAARRSFALALLVLATAAVAVATAPAASAHADLESTTPPNGAILGEAPTIATLRFTEAVEVPGSGPELFDSDQDPVPIAGFEIVDDGLAVEVDLPPLDDGTYVMTFRAVSGDGHPVSGSFTFSVGSESTNAEGLADAVSSGESDGTVDRIYTLLRAVVFGGVIVGLGAFLFVVFIAPDRAAELRRLIDAAVATIGVASALQLLVIGPFVIGGGLGDAFSAIGDALDADAGRAAAGRVLLAAVGLGLARGLAHATKLRPSVTMWAFLVISTFSFVGHPRTGRWQGPAIAADLVHFGAATLWIGGLISLFVVVGRTRSEDAAPIVRRFSSTAVVAVAVVVATGVFQAFRQLEELQDTFETTYGRVLVAKVVLVGIVVALGARSRSITRRRIEAADGASALRKVVLAESAIAVAIVMLTAVLVNANPPRADAEMRGPAIEEATPIEMSAAGGDLTFAITISPGVPGPNTVVIEVADSSGAPVDLFELAAELHPVDASIAPLPIEFEGSGGRYTADAVAVPFGTTYTFSIRALTGPIEQIDVDTQITFP